MRLWDELYAKYGITDSDLRKMHGNIKEVVNKYDFLDMDINYEKITGEFAKRLISVFPERFCAGIIYGPRGSGKSIYALKTASQIFSAFGLDEEEAWKCSLLSMYFDAIRMRRDIFWLAREGVVVPILIWDDAGVSGSGSLYMTDRWEYENLRKLFNIVRTVVSGFIITTPSLFQIFKHARDNVDVYRLCVSEGEGKYDRMVLGYKVRIMPDGTLRICPHSSGENFCDKANIHLPNEKYLTYKGIRMLYIRELEELEEEENADILHSEASVQNSLEGRD